MRNYESLWRYQQVDLKISAAEQRLKGSETRKKLKKAYDYLNESKQSIRNMEAEASGLRVSYDTSRQKIEDINDQITDIGDEMKVSADSITLQEIDRLRKETVELQGTLVKQEKEIQQVLEALAHIDDNLRKIATNIPKARSDYDTFKKLYDAERDALTEEIKPLQEQITKMAAELDKDLMAKYTAVKKQFNNPLAMMIGGQCMGCNMELPSATLKKLAAEGDAIIECDNCGRILYPK